jgi:putative hemolysin
MTLERPLRRSFREGFTEIRSGHLGVRLAANAAEIDAVQALRFRVFFEEMGAHPSPEAARRRRDADRFDAIADHLVVIDHKKGNGPQAVVGTYRLIRREAAARLGAFYSESEFDISRLLAFPGHILELGRSCVHPDYRASGAMQLLWQGIAAYVFHHRIDLMFGCASLHGTDPDALAAELTYLYNNHLAPPALRPVGAIDPRRVVQRLPPLVKGYLRLGGFVGEGAVIDAQFNTTDVIVLVKTDLVTDKYYRHYERQLRNALS